MSLNQALFGDLPEDTKISAEVKSQKALLKLAGSEPALQLAQLVALEHLLAVTLPARTKEVSSLLYRPALSCVFATVVKESSSHTGAAVHQHMRSVQVWGGTSLSHLWVLHAFRGASIPC